ncbi:helix-turn-helix domain-containing protein [Leucobacter sp. CSA1]|uniref:Helix-turn-helix domain-containing protein n=1 Tax=Leucobacter chromiisoli TaxID=2796471 RepID=A0A934UV86_9MICO|nr:helix-turn-helix domain-containing protein [Leucobacter chromiisoli]MBK0418968.1 helix-turn-helix domain-containing protein [Leucobacter chromiisoli]
MSLSLRKLLQNPSLHLRLVVGGKDDAPEQHAFDQEFEWLHATDMIDPTPFLGPAEVILTLGWQFPVTSSADPSVPEVRVSPERLDRIYDDYAALVAAHGVIGIGFGSDVLHKGVPHELARACIRHGLILFDVPYEISFMDLLQEAARVLQRDQTERYTRSLRAQKAIANAATRRDGLTATLRETARQLGCGVALYDSLGHPVTLVEAPEGPRVQEAELTPIVRRTLEGELRFRSTQVTPEVEAVLQMLGEPGDPSGMLVLTLSRGFDDVSRNVLSSVLALVSVSLEQNQALASLHTTLRQALLQLLLSGSIGVTRHIVESVWGPLPTPPIVTLVGIPQHFDAGRIMPALESMSPEEERPVFFAQYRSDIAVLVHEDDAERVIRQLRSFGMVLGRSRCDRWEGLELALEEAKKAAEFGLRRGAAGVTAFPDIWRDGVADLIDASDATHVARRVLGPLSAHDRAQGSELLRTLQVWLKHHGRQLPAARELEVHRHTLTNRLDQIASLTGSDLEDFQVRADLALALRYYRREQTVEESARG